MSTQIENQPTDYSHFLNRLPQVYRTVLKDFRRIVQSFILFHALFILTIAAEAIVFLSFLAQSAMIAFALGAIFLTAFSYLVLLFYLSARKPEKIFHLKEKFLKSCRVHISFPVGEPQHHLSIAEALNKLASYLEDFEKNFYKFPPFLQALEPFFSRLSTYCYREDVFSLKRLLLAAAIDEHLKQIRVTPTDLEVHASLATTYVAQSKLLRNGRKFQPALEESFRASSRLAIEEFRILNHYAPNDPWVHEQLACGFYELGMPEEELREVECLFKLRPQDKEILFRLGKLYFHQGMNAKGLQIYEDLRQSNFKKAEDLIASYGRLT